jgi:hypothetical protein
MKNTLEQKRTPVLTGLKVMALSLAVAYGGAFAAGNEGAAADDSGNSFRLSGYVRSWASFNLQDVPETRQNDRGDLSMLRTSLSLNADAQTGPLQWKAIGRLDRELNNSYLRRLETLNRSGLSGGPGSNIMSLYNQGELREFYVDVKPTDLLSLRIGKQQVVWGETDFFHTTDLIHGFDYRWRSFIERDNDEIRKPLILVNAKLDVPAANGTLQVIVRPGLDRDRDIGNTYDLSGGRWAPQPNKGVDFLSPDALNLNYRHPDGNTKDTTGGVRWTGISGPVNYSFSYLKTYNPNPVVNSAFVPYKQQPTGKLGDFIYPKIDVFGGSVSADIQPIDSVLSAEIAYQKDVPYNVGTNFFGGALPGFGGIKTKNVVVSALRLDKQLRLMNLLGTNQPSFFSIQLFDTWIRNYDRADDLVEQAGFGAPVREHTTMLTGFITLNYNHSKTNPGLAFGADVTNGDAFLIPSVEFQWGNNWRLVAEADFFFPNNQKRPGQVETSAHALGGFAHNDQFLLRLTYQF